MNPTVQRLIVFYSTLVDIFCFGKKMQGGWTLTLLFLNQPLVKVCLGFFSSMGIVLLFMWKKLHRFQDEVPVSDF